MALTWNIEKVKDWKQKKKKQRNRVLLDALIYLTMTIGINKITEKNFIQFFMRVSTYEQLRGACILKKNGKPLYITLDDVRTWIGLTTNADNFSVTQYEKRLLNLAKFYGIGEVAAQ